MAGTKVPYRIGSDLVIQDDVSRFGLHRLHIIHYRGMPDVEAQMQGVPRNAVKVHAWVWMDEKGTGHQVIVWKESE